MSLAEDKWGELCREEEILHPGNFYAILQAYGRGLRGLAPSLSDIEYTSWVALHLARCWVCKPWKIPEIPGTGRSLGPVSPRDR